MITNIFDVFKKMDPSVKSTIITSLTTLIVLILGWLFRVIYEQFSFKFKLKNEYEFIQTKKIKENISEIKTPLIRAAEELNYRFWNLNKNIHKNWLNVKKEDWTAKEKYYIRSSAYRFIVFYYWIIKSEEVVYKLDTTLADKKDKNYMKFIKCIKHTISDREILSELGYKISDTSNHFYKDVIPEITNYCLNEDGTVINYEEFSTKMKTDFSQIEKVLSFFSEIKNSFNNYNRNTIVCLHLIIIIFLNKFGFDYQHTSNKKLKKLCKSYKEFKVGHSYINFLKRNKLYSEMYKVFYYLRKGVIYQIFNIKKIKKYEI